MYMVVIMADDKIKQLVTSLQQELLVQGINPGPIDGLMGNRTYQAIVAYQHRTLVQGVRPSTPPVPKKAPVLTDSKTWRPARAINQLLSEVNNLYPIRSKTDDGIIGDARHAAHTSDHNPWVHDSNGQPVVTAVDITNDPVHGPNINSLIEKIMHDKRIKYIIFMHHIYNPSVSPDWRPYTGKDPHTGHVHISIKSDENLYDNTDRWL